jgi:hypothetical protein
MILFSSWLCLFPNLVYRPRRGEGPAGTMAAIHQNERSLWWCAKGEGGEGKGGRRPVTSNVMELKGVNIF